LSKLTAAKLNATDLDAARLLFDLKLVSELACRFTGWLEADAIAICVTEGLVEQFGCAFARIWIVDSDRTQLRLVASSGLYTRLDGSFARVPMGAFKVGKIAQHCIPFLSNCLAEESWVKDRHWAIANQIQGFAGLPLMVQGQAIGVLAVFSHRPMASEFLEVFQILSMSVTGALASALNHQALSQQSLTSNSLSEQLATILGQQKLSLLGTEQPLSPSVTRLLIRLAKQIAAACHYCRLVYEANGVVLEAMLATSESPSLTQNSPEHIFKAAIATAQALGGTFQSQLSVSQPGGSQQALQIRLQLPQRSPSTLSAAITPLSEREQEVIWLLAQGLRDKDIAEKLYISERTVKFHVKNMLQKLGVRTRIQAVFEASQQGWIA
jgi:DNA-binding NarL/FixJ family response regulator